MTPADVRGAPAAVRAARAVRPAPAARALLGACHPAPTVGVTVVLTALALAAGHSGARAAAIGGASLLGQLSIGWCNDAVDARRDAAAGRGDKPVAAGAVGVRTVAVAAALALAGCAAASLAVGVVAGLAHLAAVGAGWVYDLGAKSTPLSWLPYAVGFGLFPSWVILALPGTPAPPVWLVAAGALLGVAAHGANVLPDLADDAATGVRGAPHRAGRTATLRATAALLVAATIVLVTATLVTPGPVTRGPLAAGLVAGRVHGVLTGVTLAAAVAAAGVVVVRGRDPHARSPFLAVLLLAAVDVGLLLASGGALRTGA